MTFCECGYWATSRITQVITCPICQRFIQVFSLEDQGRYAWYRLHTEPNPTREWFETVWLKLIPKHDCECRSKFNAIMARMPPDFSSVEAFRRWAVDAHNEVNASIGKPRWAGSYLDALSTSFVITQGAVE